MTTRLRILIGAVVAIAVATTASVALASIDPDAPAPILNRGPSEIVLSALGPGTSVQGQIGPSGSVSDPSVAYPPPLTGFTPLNESFAGVIEATPPGGGPPTLQMYCINILTPTAVGYGYNLGTWSEANVNNVGYVARLLNDYYPNTALPANGGGITNDATRAAAVQAAIWYFSDNYVVNATDPKFAAVQEIVNTVRTQPPLPAPTEPDLTITPPANSGDAGTLVGPYTITTVDTEGATLTITGADAYSDAAGTVPVPSGSTVPDGTQLWLRSDTVGDATIEATATATVPSGNAYLYSGNVEGVTEAQKLILAESVEVSTSTSALARFNQATTTSTSTTSTTSTSTTSTSTTSTTSTTAPTSTTTTPSGPGSDVGNSSLGSSGGVDGSRGGSYGAVSSGELAFTGSDRRATTVMTLVALTAILTGGVLLGLRRRLDERISTGSRQR